MRGEKTASLRCGEDKDRDLGVEARRANRQANEENSWIGGIGQVRTSVSIDFGVDFLLAHVAGVSARRPVGFRTLGLDEMEKAHAEMGDVAHTDVTGHALGHVEERVCHVDAGERGGQAGGADITAEKP
jgi:hypothetical protein